MIHLKTPEEIAVMREGGKILRQVANELTVMVAVGVKLKALDARAEKLMRAAGGAPAFLGYKPEWAKKPYRASICASVNEVLVHGVPNAYALKDGDVVKLDFGFLYKGFYTDTALTVGVGMISDEARQLISVTRDALILAIDQCFVGKTLGDVGFAINAYVRKHGFHIAKGLTGHGIGQNLHEDPVVHNEGKPGTRERLKVGMVIAIEPMVSAGSGEIIQLKKDESFATKEGVISAHFEDTVAITDDGPEVLTS